MSRLNTNSDSHAQFGLFLPMPLIENIEISTSSTSEDEDDSSGADQLLITLGLYLQGEGTEPPENSLQTINDLYVYVVFLIGNTAIQKVIAKQRYYDISYSLAQYEEDGAYYVLSADEELITINKNYEQIQISEFEYVGIAYYDETLQKNIYKYTTDVSLSIEGTYSTFEELFDVAYISAEDGITYKDITVFCFSSIYDFGGESASDTIDALQNYYLFNKFNSNITYEQVFKNGIPYGGADVVFKYADGAPYEGEVIQALDGTYHAAGPATTLITIINDFRMATGPYISPLLDQPGESPGPITGNVLPYFMRDTESESAAEEILVLLTDAESTLDGVPADNWSVNLGSGVGTSAGSGLVTSQGQSSPANVLNAINKAAAAIPNKSTVTQSGKLYNALTNLIGRTNNSVQAQPTIYPDFNRNPKIVDAREASLFAAYVAPEPEVETAASSLETTPDRIYGQVE